MRDRVPRRDSHTDIHASVKAQRNNQCDRSECAHPSVPEQQAKYRRHIHQQNTGDRQRYATRREELIAGLEQLYGALDTDEAVLPSQPEANIDTSRAS